MRLVLEAMKALELHLDGDLENHIQTIFMQPSLFESEQLPTEVVDAIETLYMDSEVRGCLKRAREYQLTDGAE